MSSKRAEPFLLALTEIRARLQNGSFRLDERLAATEIADELGLSATPVREAMSRLAGAGLIEDRRGQGYFVRRLSGADVADLYRLSLAHLTLALERRAAPAPADPTPAPLDASPWDAVEQSERLFAAWVAAPGGRLLMQSHARLQVQLGPARRVEPRLVADLDLEVRALMALDPAADRATRLARVRAFHARRIRLAAAIAEALERRDSGRAL